MRIQTFLLAVTAVALLFAAGCKKDDDGTEEEFITRVVVHLTGPGFDQEFEAEDSDGDGVFNSIDEIVLPPNSTFNCHLHVYDDTKNPVEDITEEIEKENTEHLFVFKINTANLTVSGRDTDDNGAPLGLTSTWTTAAASTGNIQIVLYHEPTDKNAVDPGGEVDFDVTFPVKIQ